MDADADGGGKAIERDLSTFSGYRNRIARRKMSAAAATLSLESNTHLLAGSLPLLQYIHNTVGRGPLAD